MQKNIKIDPKKLSAFLVENQLSSTQLSRKLSRSDSFISQCAKRGFISRKYMEEICFLYGIKMNHFSPDNSSEPVEFEPSNKVQYPFSVSIKVDDGVLKFSVLKNGVQDKVSFVKLAGDSDVDFYRAMSYAAHICRKLEEQDSIGGI